MQNRILIDNCIYLQCIFFWIEQELRLINILFNLHKFS